jgi:hypothetical protein
MFNFSEISTATIDQLTDELAAAGWDSCETSIRSARGSVARLLNATAGLALYDSETALVIRPATDDEAAESANAGSEGHILVDGRRCYVAQVTA